MGLKPGRNDVWWCPSLTLFEVALFGKMPLIIGKNVVWWCSSLTLRVSIARWKSQGRNFKTDASSFYVSMETAKTQLKKAAASNSEARRDATVPWLSYHGMNPDTTGKALVAQRFARSAATYNDAAIVQRQMAQALVDMLTRATPPRQFERALELGCGTGLLTDLLISDFAIEHLSLNDLTAELVAVAQRCRTRQPKLYVNLLPGDMESISLPGDQDLVTSSAALQWTSCPERMLQRMLAALRPDGLLAIATFGPQNLRETRALTGNSLNYVSLERLIRQLAKHAAILSQWELVEQVRFESAREVLRHLKRTGANALHPTSWTPGAFRSFCADYESRFKLNGHVPLTYHPMLVVARRNAQTTWPVR